MCLTEMIGPWRFGRVRTPQTASISLEDHFYPEIIDPSSGEPWVMMSKVSLVF